MSSIAFRQSKAQTQAQTQRLNLAPKQIESLNLLAKTLPELRTEIYNEMSKNPAIESVENVLETPLGNADSGEYAQNAPDYPEDDYTPGGNPDEDAAERRQAFFDRQVEVETLQQHLLKQLLYSDIPPGDYEIAANIISDLDSGGYYKGSLANMQMGYDKTESQVQEIRKKIMQFDPPGCGAQTARECLLAQVDNLENTPLFNTVKRMIDEHLVLIAEGKHKQVVTKLGVTDEEYNASLKLLRSLNPHPGSIFPSESDRVEYINPEVRAVKRGGIWVPETDSMSLPEIKISESFKKNLEHPDEEVKAYAKNRIEAAEALRESVLRRQRTIEAIARVIFEHQQDFFTLGFKALKPLTESEVADKVGVSTATVSRTVCNKYTSTPFGTKALKSFFASGIINDDGNLVAREAVLDKLQELVDNEDSASPLSDQDLANKLKALGYPIARRTVQAYRERLGIPPKSER